MKIFEKLLILLMIIIGILLIINGLYEKDIILIFFGALFVFFSSYPLYTEITYKRNLQHCKVKGKLVQATIDRVYLVNSNSYLLDAHVKINNKIYFFTSYYINFNIKAVLDVFQIKEIPVYIDLFNPHRYIVDTNCLKKYLGN